MGVGIRGVEGFKEYQRTLQRELRGGVEDIWQGRKKSG